jgi:site-specific recombinase XerD
MTTNLLSLKQAAELYHCTPDAIRSRIRRGHLPATKGMVNGVEQWLISPQNLLKNLYNKTYTQIEEDWLQGLLKGVHVEAAQSPKTVTNRKEGIESLWRYSNLEPSIRHLVAASIRRAFQNMPVDHSKKRDFFATKEQMIKSVKSLLNYCILYGFAEPEQLVDVETIKIKRRFDPRKRTLVSEQLAFVFQFNRQWQKGRTDYDIVLTDTLLHLMAYGALRQAEVLNLKADKIDLSTHTLDIYGKGAHEDIIDMPVALENSLAAYLAIRPVSYSSQLLLTQEGFPFSKYHIDSRIRRLSEAVNIPFSCHDLRRSCLSIMVTEANKPITFAQRHARHRSIKTTHGYIIQNPKHVSDFIRNFDPAHPQ